MSILSDKYYYLYNLTNLLVLIRLKLELNFKKEVKMFGDMTVINSSSQGAEQPVTNKPEEASDDNKDLVEKLKANPILLIGKESKFRKLENIKPLASPETQIVVCDTNVSDFFKEEEGKEPVMLDGAKPIDGGFQIDNVINIDHHFPTPEFSRIVSSTNLAIDYVRKHGPFKEGAIVVINHTDCDSILASAIMRGIIEPDDKYGEAAIAADHTGEPNEIADLLLALDGKRDVEFSLRNLQLLLYNKPLEEEAAVLLEARIGKREKAKNAVENLMKVTESGNVHYAELPKKIDGELFPSLIPEAKIIILTNPLEVKEGDTVVKVVKEVKARLGLGAPEGTNLRTIMKKADPLFDGRWNAGSNGRNGGLDLNTDMEDYIHRLDVAATEYFNNLGR